MKKNLFILLFMSMAVVFVSCVNDAPTTVKVEGGKVEGILENGLRVFRGIPFAKPPVGELRWKAPQPVHPWEGIRKAKQFAPSCPQITTIEEHRFLELSEDCLYLNVWTPAQSSGEKLPIMVWIYGGGFTRGSASLPFYSGEELARHGIVVVSITYRVGALGFLAHPELTAESPDKISGNYGLLDQIAALQWVQKNIEAFGGDPSKVTIFGESAGAISVSMLCASPLAKRLFRGAISESGGSFAPVHDVRGFDGILSLQAAEQEGVAFAQRMGAGSIAELRKIKPEKWISDPMSQMGGFWPTVDGYVILDDQYKLYEQGKYNDVNVLIGTNSDEGTMFANPAASVEAYQENIRARFGAFADRVLEAYPAHTIDETYYASADIFRETIFAWPTYAWANLQSATGQSSVFVYYFDQPQPRSSFDQLEPRGAAHASEIDYVFGHLAADQRTESDFKLSKMMIDYWTNFAKHGNPNGENLPQWETYSAGNPFVLLLKDVPQRIDWPNKDKLLLMEEYFSALRREK
jgi:para-nitrobenzyl esterase